MIFRPGSLCSLSHIITKRQCGRGGPLEGRRDGAKRSQIATRRVRIPAGRLWVAQNPGTEF